MEERTLTGQPPASRGVSRFFGQKLIKIRFQMKFGLIIFAFLSIATAIIWLEGRIAVRHMVNSGMIVSEDARLQLELLSGIIARTSVIAVAITFGLALFFSHFIAGPIYRFEKTLEEMQNGNLNLQVRLRKHDEFKDVGDAFNRTLASLRNRIRKDRDTALVSLEQAAVALREKGANDKAAELDKVVAELKSNPQIRL